VNCIICFLTDSFHDKLRNFARLKSDRFEDAIKEYQNLFLSEFEFLSDVSECHIHNSIKEETKKWCKDLQNALKEIDDIPGWFEKIRQIYITWVGGNFSDSLSLLKDFLDEKVIFEENNGGEYIFCMRGRKSSSAFSKEDLFHIPFNKRHLVSNQRYSITGIPLLYLGLSPITIFYELRAQPQDLTNLYFSSFVLQNPSSLTIADTTNRFPHFYSNFKGLHDGECPISFDDPIFGSLKEEYQNEFRKFVLSSLCSFKVLERLEGNSFVEEYVLPQLLSERVRQMGYDGISYSSTKVSNLHCYSEEVFHVNKYRENIVLFTRYSQDRNYDEKLLEKFYISRPVRLPEMYEIKDDEIERLKKEIIQLNNKSNKFGNFIDLLSEYSGIKFKVLYEKLMIQSYDSSFVAYDKHDLGKIHRFLLFQHMLSVRNWLKET